MLGKKLSHPTVATTAAPGFPNLPWENSAVRSPTLPGGGIWGFAPVAAVGVVDTAAGYGTVANPAAITSPSSAIATWTNPLGGVRQLAVDALGNVIRDVAADGTETLYARDSNGRITSVTQPDPDGAGPLTAPVTTYTYNSTGDMTQMVLPGGATRSWTWNSAHQPLTEMDELGQTTTFVWNSNRTLASKTLPTGATISYAYNSLGQVTSVALPDPDGAGPLTSTSTTNVYDNLGRLTSVTNPDGTSRTWTYNSLDQILTATDELGRTTWYGYSWMGRVAQIGMPDPDGSGPLIAPSVHYNFDILGRVISEFSNNVLIRSISYNTAGQVEGVILTDPDGAGPLTDATTTQTYNAMGWLTTQTTPGGATVSYNYDSAGRVLTVTTPDPDGSGPQSAAVTSYSYDTLGRTVSVTDALNAATTVTYNDAGQVASITDGLGHTSSSTYNAAGQVLTVTNALNETTTYAYNSLGQLTSITLPDPDDAGPLPAPVTSSTYDLLGRAISVTAPDGGISTIEYDSMGRTVKQTSPDGSFLTLVYDAASQVSSQSVSAPGADVLTTSFGYDGLGRTTSVVTPSGTFSSSYDDAGNLVSATDAAGNVSSYGYDLWGRQVSFTDSQSNQSTTTYNTAGLVAQVTDALLNTTSLVYDDAGRLITSTDANGDSTSYEYDVLGRTTRLVDAVGNATSWTYDAIGQLLTDTQELSNSTTASRSFVWDAAGQLTSKTDRNGRTITFGYDHLGRQVSQDWLENGSSVNTIATTYDASLRVASISDGDSVYAFTWDNMGRLLTVDNTGTAETPAVVLTNSWDALGRLAGFSATVDSVDDFVNSYSYDTAGRISQITQTDGDANAGDAIADKRIDFAYDSAGRLSAIDRYQSLTTGNAVAATSFSYDTNNRLTSLQHVAQSTALAGYTYTWDAADRLTSIDSVKDGLTTYSYDATSQLTGADHTGQTDESFTYDSNGNRLSVARLSESGSSSSSNYTTGDHNRILSDGIFTYSYYAEGNRTSKTEISTGEVVEYSWSHVNQLTAVTYKDSNNTVTKSVTYGYDALGRRIGKSVDATGDGIVDRSETYIYDGAGLLADASGSIHISGPNGETGQHGWVDQMVLSFVDADGDGSGVATLASRNLYGAAVDQIFASEVASGDVLWALSDHQGTVRDWTTFDDATDTTTVAAHIRYSSFGSIESITDSSGTSLSSFILPPSSFTGQLYDLDADLLYYRALWYDPQLGKFLNDDPMGFAAGDTNVSRYVGNGANHFVDPSGLVPPNDDFDPFRPRGRREPPKIPPEPTVLDQFRCPWTLKTDPNRDLTPWFEERYPGHTTVAKTLARRRIADHGGPGVSPFRTPVVVHTVKPDNDDNASIVVAIREAVKGRNSVEQPKGNGEGRFGDEEQTKWEANASLGNFSYVLTSVQFRQFEQNAWEYTARIEAWDHLGLSPGDGLLADLVVGRIFRAREHELVTRATWVITGVVDGP